MITPLYLSPDKCFFVTEYIERPTAMQVVRESDNLARIAQVYRRGGAWLHALHSCGPQREAQFWPNWMVESVEEKIALGPLARAAQYEPFLARFKAECATLTRAPQRAGFSHGDFHSRNLLLGRGLCYGLDFTEVTDKLLVYDCVDFLKMDVHLDLPKADIDRSGISAHHRDMFFRRYRHQINPEVFECAMRGRLLIDWLAITPKRYKKTDFQRTKFDRLADRLEIAFSTG